MMKATEVRKMSAAELDAKLLDLKKDLFQLRLQHATNQLDNPIRIADPVEVTCVELFHLFQLEGPDGDVMYLHKFAKL